jgi:hypothetical protein
VREDEFITPFYRVKFNKEMGNIIQIYSAQNDWNMLNSRSEWSFFELVRETIDPRFHQQVRSTLFPRNLELGNKSISQWNHEWKACREGADKVLCWHIDQGEDSISFIRELEVAGMDKVEQTITFSTRTSRIKMKVKLIKKPVCMPEAIYFALPMQLKENWECSFDSAGEFVRLDKDQLGNACRDYITVDKSVSLYDEEKGITLSCPDAPMVQVGDFNFGKENKEITRKENPLLLAWPLNNYWDTNFMADQKGAMEFHYELTPFKKFDEKEAYTISMAAEKPYVIGAAVSCDKEETGCLLRGEGEVMPVYIKPSREAKGSNKELIVVLKNLTDRNQEYSFTVPVFPSFTAQEVTVQEKGIKQIEVINQKATIPIPPHSLKMIRVTQTELDR